MNLRNLKLKPRLLLTFGVMALVFGSAIALAVARLSAFNQAVQTLTTETVPDLENTDGWLTAIMDTARRTRSMVIRDKDHVQEEIDGARRSIEKRVKAREAAIAAAVTPEAKSALKPLLEASERTVPLESKYMDLFQAGRKEEAVALLDSQMRAAEHDLLEVFKPYQDFENAAVKARADELAATYRASMTLLLALSGIALLVGAVLAFATAQALSKPMERIIRHFEAFAAGDFTDKITVDSTNEIGQVLTALQLTQESLGKMVRQIKTAAGSVFRGAEEISQGNANLSQRTEEQSSSLEETASSMEEMTSTVKQNADNAGQANQLATAARDQAEKGGAVVGRAVSAMTEINESSKKIADIIGVIDEIAFQTNLLALNAAVEAARAGEQGRGFAVVATEVRSLAGRSATAAKEIKDLIQDSVRKVEDGSALVTQSGQTLEQIVSSVKKVSDIIAEIAAASREQSSGIEQVNKAVMQMDEMTQQNAALVEEATAASQSMAEQASQLNSLMEHYQIPGGDPVIAAAPERPVERRGANRPWSGRGAQPGKSAAPEAADPAPARAAAPARVANGGDTEWKDF
jgi:methyl-accepting chemotaxis protein